MAYALKYRMEFKDIHSTHPAAWRIDISERDAVDTGITMLTPMGSSPLILDYQNSKESKTSYIIGREATLSYVYSRLPGEPLPDVFFDSVDERKFRMDVYVNNKLEGVFWIKSDGGGYPYTSPSFAVSISAVDGFAFAKTTLLDMYLDGRVVYEYQTLAKIISDAVYKVLEPGTPIYIINTLRPKDITAPGNFWTVVKSHTELFFSFTEGPISVYKLLEIFAAQFYGRFFMSEGVLWFIRTEDIYDDVVSVYTINGDPITLPAGIVQSINPNTFPAVENTPNVNGIKGLKQQQLTINYRSINQLVNFDWHEWAPLVGFNSWFGSESLMRGGTGVLEDPYTAILPFGNKTLTAAISQFTVNTGPRYFYPSDIVEVAFKYTYSNMRAFDIILVAVPTNGTNPQHAMDASGTWVNIEGKLIDELRINLVRSGRKQQGSFEVRSQPIPSLVGQCTLWFWIVWPYERSYHIPKQDGDIIDVPPGIGLEGVFIEPVKIGVISSQSIGTDIKIRNKANYSGIGDDETINYSDMGDTHVANTLLLNATPIENWESTKPDITPYVIERHSAQSRIDGYAKSIKSFEGNVYSNTFRFYNTLKIDGLPGKKFMVLRDKYNVFTCMHSIVVEEVLPEQYAQTVYTQIDKYP